MPTWLEPVLKWAVDQLLRNLNTDWAKQGLIFALTEVDAAVQAADARVTGQFKGLADEAAKKFDEAVKEIVAVLSK